MTKGASSMVNPEAGESHFSEIFLDVFQPGFLTNNLKSLDKSFHFDTGMMIPAIQLIFFIVK